MATTSTMSRRSSSESTPRDSRFHGCSEGAEPLLGTPTGAKTRDDKGCLLRVPEYDDPREVLIVGGHKVGRRLVLCGVSIVAFT
jgi:hypothetical protein